MKPISIRTQKVLAFVPLINFIGIFVLIYQCHVLNEGKKTLWKALLFLIPLVILFGILMALVNFFTANTIVYDIVSWLSLYLFPLIVFEATIIAQQN